MCVSLCVYVCMCVWVLPLQLEYDADLGTLQIAVNNVWQEEYISGITGAAE